MEIQYSTMEGNYIFVVVEVTLTFIFPLKLYRIFQNVIGAKFSFHFRVNMYEYGEYLYGIFLLNFSFYLYSLHCQSSVVNIWNNIQRITVICNRMQSL